MDEEQTALEEARQWVQLQSARPLIADDAAPRRRVSLRVLALAAVVALGAGIGIGAMVTDGGGAGDEAAIAETEPIDSPPDADRSRLMVPKWLPDGLELQTADDNYGPGPSCQPSAIDGAAPAAPVSGAIPVGPGVCATPTFILRFVSAPLPGAVTLSFIQAGPADIRTPVTTSPITVRGKNGLLYRSGESLWLAWTEDAEKTFFVTTTGLSVDDVLRVAESVAVIDAEEWARLRSTSARSAPASNATTGRTDLVVCLRAQGLEVPDLPTGPTSVTSSRQYPPQAAQAAWQACRDTYARSSGMPTNQLSQILAVPDCMAAQGWLLVVMSGPATDSAAFNAAMQKCQPVASTGPPGRTEIAVCLRAQGLDVPEVPTGSASVTPSRQYPADVAQAAWQACRDAYIKSSGIPPSPLSLYDCMAAQGWLLVVMSGPPTDSAAFNAAMQKCQPVGSSAGPPGQVELVGCLRTQGLDVPDRPIGPASVTPSRQYPADVAQAAWQACRDAYIKSSGIPPSPLSLYDCMAGYGWIIATFTGPPADTVAYGSASQSCAQRN